MSAVDILDGIRGWVEIESHTADLAGVQAMVAEVEGAYRALGATTERAPGQNGCGDHLIARAPWNDVSPGFLIVSHLDTVHPKGTLALMPFRVEGDKAFGPGIYDMKGGAYIAFHALGRFLRSGTRPPRPVTHLFLSDEEIGSPTSRPLIERLAAESKVVLVTEPAREGGRIVTARKGVARYDLETFGIASHAGSRHQDGRNAIAEMCRQILKLEAMTDYEAGVTVNVGLVAGGTGVNVVPAHCTARVEARVPIMAAAEAVCAAIEGLAPHDPDVRIAARGGLNRPPYEKSPAIEALFAHAKGLAAEIGFELQDISTGGCSDGNFTAPITPTLDGLGVDGQGGHSDHEQLYVSSLEPRSELLYRLIATL
ncbi:MAG TPA: M20 family metallopeptidase [Geminicoccaceae bacterium]|nr:M20 family metallopeptidase [Geminicoccaceae bacterium]